MSGPPALARLDRTTRLAVLALLAFCGSFLLGESYTPSLSYFWALGAGRLLLAFAVAVWPRTNAGRFRPYLVALTLLALLSVLLTPSSLFQRWVLLTLLYLTLEVALDSSVLENATEQEVPLEIGILSGARLLGLWSGLILQNASTLPAGFAHLTSILLASLALFWLVVRERREDLLLPTSRQERSEARVAAGEAFRSLAGRWTGAAVANLFALSFVTGYSCGAVLPYPLLHPDSAGEWLVEIGQNLQLLGAGLGMAWLLEKSRLRTQLLFAAAGTLLILSLPPALGTGRLPSWSWGVLLAAILLSTRAVLRETFRVDPVVRAALIVSLWTAGGLSGEMLSHRAGPWVVVPAAIFALAFAAAGLKRYSQVARFESGKFEPARAERFGDRKQDFEAVPEGPARGPRLRPFRTLANLLLVRLPVALFLTAAASSLLAAGLYFAQHRVEWQIRVENSVKVLRVKLFLSAFAERLHQDMLASHRVPDDLGAFISQNFESGGKPLTDVDPWGTPYHFEIAPREIVIRCAGPDRRLGTTDDLEQTVARPEGVKR